MSKAHEVLPYAVGAGPHCQAQPRTTHMWSKACIPAPPSASPRVVMETEKRPGWHQAECMLCSSGFSWATADCSKKKEKKKRKNYVSKAEYQILEDNGDSHAS